MRANHRLLVWAPRVLGIAMALFLSVFALDAFSEPAGLLERAGALAVHLTPSASVALMVAVAWRWELAGALGFAALGVTYLALAHDRFPWTTLMAIPGPLLFTGALLVASWAVRRHRDRAPSSG
jgi:hypothetical protein